MWPVQSELCEATAGAVPPPPRAGAAMARAMLIMSRPAPPYAAGTVMPQRPSSASGGTSSSGNFPWRSHSRACGRISRAAKSRTVWWISRCSSVRWKSTRLSFCLRRSTRRALPFDHADRARAHDPPADAGVVADIHDVGHVLVGLGGLLGQQRAGLSPHEDDLTA